MIRPITIVTFLMACGSGLYLYQSKHEVQLLDRTIEKAVRDAGALREQSRLLATEWSMLNDPERLRQFSDTYLNVKSIDPKQYTSLADLDSRLPAPRIEAPAPGPIETPVAGDSGPATMGEAEPAVVADQKMLPVPPIPTVRPVQVATPAAHPIEARVALARPPMVTEGRPSDNRSSEARSAEMRLELRPAEPKPAPWVAEMRTPAVPPTRPIVLAAPRPQPVYTPPTPLAVSAPGLVQTPVPYRQAMPASPVPAPYRQAMPAFQVPAPYSGSLLGMARGTMPPTPRPVPVNATYNAN
jgi:hypothetical protein